MTGGGLRMRHDSAQSRSQAIVSATASIIPQRVLPLGDLLLVQALVSVGLVVGLVLDRPGWPGWYGVAAGLAVASVCVVRRRGGSIPRWLVGRLGFWWERRRRKKGGDGDGFKPFNAPLLDGAKIGLHWDGSTLLSLVRIRDNPHAITVMDPATTLSTDMVSVQTLSDCLRQFDITVDAIDVISKGARFHGASPIGATYEAVLGPLPAIAARSVWVAVRLDPTLCPEAVRHRGGGWDGVVRTAATATRRIANRLADAGLHPQIMAADEIVKATEELADGVDLRTLHESWFACHEGKFRLRSYAVEPSLFTSAGLDILWTVPSRSTTVCVSLRRDERKNVVKLRGLARFDGSARNGITARGLRHLRGRQYAALMCTLPLPAPRRSVREWVFAEPDDAMEGLALPTSGCGQVVGADDDGRAVALPLFGPNTGRVEMCGPLHLAQQVVLRSLALGARVHVSTRRAAAWRAMVEQVGDPGLLSVTDGGSTPTGSDRDHSVEVFDGTAVQQVRAGVTTMVVKPSHAQPTREADVTLQVLDHDHDVVQVKTREHSAVVTMVATEGEMRYLKQSFDMVD